ncbi:putative patatin-like phospholipase, partial [Mimivirus AB-566-O17]
MSFAITRHSQKKYTLFPQIPPCFLSSNSKQMYTSLVIEGGGSKNIASIGALDYLHNHTLLNNIVNYAGTSSGAILCILLVMNYTPKEIKDVVFNGTLNKYIKNNFFMNAYNLFNKYGLNNPNKVIKLMGKLFTNKGFSKNITFKELYHKTHKTLVITGTNISKQKIVYFNYLSHPDVPVLAALRITMNIPIFFTRIKHNGDYYVDGFLLMNFPLYYFDHPDGHLCNDSTELTDYFPTPTPNNKTLGIFTLDPDER